MWKKLIGVAAIFTVACLASAQDAGKPAASRGAAPGEQSESVKKLIYVVQPNDTMWDISRRFLNSPYYWPKIWERNQYIINPKLIYPGDVINLYPESEKLTPPPVETVPKIGDEKTGTGLTGEAKIVRDEEGRVIRVYYKDTSTTGWIETGALDKAGKIIKIEENHGYAGSYDHVYVDVGAATGVKEGDIFSVFEMAKEIRNPVTRKRIGYKIINNGEIKIVKMTQGAAEAEIVHSNFEMEKGDFIRPYSPPLSAEIPVVKTDKQAEGLIVANRRDNTTFAQHDIIYINLGKQNGIENGVMFEAYLPGHRVIKAKKLGKKSEKTELPDTVIGNVVAIDTRDKTCVGLITTSVQEFKIGEKVRVAGIK